MEHAVIKIKIKKMCVCMYVCTYVCVYVCVCIFLILFYYCMPHYIV